MSQDLEIIALNRLTGECLTTADVEPILILKCSTRDFEAGIWGAVIDNKRDWDDIEKEYLRRNQGIRESISDWCTFMKNENVTDANLEFLGQYSEVSADELQTPSADPNPTTDFNR